MTVAGARRLRTLAVVAALGVVTAFATRGPSRRLQGGTAAEAAARTGERATPVSGAEEGAAPDSSAGTDQAAAAHRAGSHRRAPATAATATDSEDAVTTDAAAGAGDAGAVQPAPRARLWDWAELLRVSALFTVPGDALAGAAATGQAPRRGTFLAIGTSLCLYHAGMALNDWADRDEDAVDRPHRPLPSGRISPAAALTAATALTAAGLALAARAGRIPLTLATTLAATVWAYDLRLKHTAAGPAAMAAARALDLVLGAAATRPRALPAALPHAALLGAHTYAVTTVSRNETQGGSSAAPFAALVTTTAIAAVTVDAARTVRHLRASASPAQGTARHGAGGTLRGRPAPPTRQAPALPRLVTELASAAYAGTALTPFLHAALNPSPPLTQRAVGGGIRAMIPLQAALAARSGAGVPAMAVLALGPVARRVARKVSPT
ncbi:SCO3242 family prenyltransferase [Actinacidiphila sp. bgisy167]|uniref:SCO3242 family prenyltransferase n=1 Tax=Actinacidiphila sp. bgisy167 TaxID=3413797 RepID=UPI003D70B367